MHGDIDLPLTRAEAEALLWSMRRYGEGDPAAEATYGRLWATLNERPDAQDIAFSFDEDEWVDVRDAIAYVLGNDMHPQARWMLEDMQDRIDALDPDGPTIRL